MSESHVKITGKNLEVRNLNSAILIGVSQMTMGAERRKPRQGDREKAEARDAALNRGRTLYTLAT